MAYVPCMLHTLGESIEAAAIMFRTFTDGRPELIPCGIKAVDRTIGGLEPGTMLVVGASTGVGKSSVALSALMACQAQGKKAGYLSVEDSAGVFGCRLLGWYSGVNSLAIRKKDFSPEEARMLEIGRDQAMIDSKLPHAIEVGYAVGAPLGVVAERLKALADKGCKVLWFDYLQKVKGHADDRRAEVGRTLTKVQELCSNYGMAAVMLSQVTREYPPGKIPPYRTLKESGDIENEARAIVMLAARNDEVVGRLDKSNYGGQGLTMSWHRKSCGNLEQVEGWGSGEL